MSKHTGSDYCENCDEMLTDDEGFVTDDGTLLCEACYDSWAEDIESHHNDCECEECAKAEGRQ